MNTHSINSMFTILIEALAETDAVHNAYEIHQHISKAQKVFNQQVLAGLPTMTHSECDLARSLNLKNRMQAFKNYRDRVGCNLMEAKNKIDAEYDAYDTYQTKDKK